MTESEDDDLAGLGSQGLSSEDLLRQAREEVAGSSGSSSDALAEAREAMPPTVQDSSPPAGDMPTARPATAPPPAAPAPRQPAPPPAMPPPSSAMPPPRNIAPPQPIASPGVPAPPRDMGLNLPPANTPQPNIKPPSKPERAIPLRLILIGVGIVGALALLMFIGTGSTSAQNLDVGDCFEIPEGSEFSRVDDQECAEPHEAQIFARVSTIIGGSTDELCIEELIPLMSSYELPDDFSIASIEGDSSSEWLCVLTSPSGALVGSII